MNPPQKIREIKVKVEQDFGSTFCLAKWYQTTIYLQTGETHSCYHPKPHEIALSELNVNPSALHNTSIKKQERKQMLSGDRPVGCQYCWNIEDMGDDYLSDRHLRNSSFYTEENIEQILSGGWERSVNPSYLEINFGNECNFKCGYCHPKFSTRYYNEILEYGPYSNVKNHRCDVGGLKLYSREDENPYVDAWWRWWPTVKKTLSVLRITGGEPTLHKSTWRLMDDLKVDPLPNLELNINSNLGTKTEIIDKLCESIQLLGDRKHIRIFKLYTSIDTWGSRAEYVRTGLNLQLWEKNLERYLEATKFPVTLMITFNILSVTSFIDLLQKILELRRRWGWYKEVRQHRIRFDTPYLREPLQYDINLLPHDQFQHYFDECLEFMKNNVDDSCSGAFSSLEYEKFLRVVDWYRTSKYSQEKLDDGRRDFCRWFTELDRRRNTNFLSVFPEMTEFWNQCRSI